MLMERLSFETLLIIIEYALDDPTLDYFARLKLMASLPLVNKQLRWTYFYKVSLDVWIPSRAFYQYWVSKLERLPREHLFNTRCRSFEFILAYNREVFWFEEQNLLKDRWANEDPIPYFMGNILTQKGLFPNLRVIHIRFGAYLDFDPYNFLFPACLPKSVTTLYLHYYIPEGLRNSSYYGEQPSLKTKSRYTPIRFSSRKKPLEVLALLVTGDEVQDENTGQDATSGKHYTDAPIFQDIARLWGSLFDATPLLFIQGTPRPIEEASKNIVSLDMSEAIKFYCERQPLEELGWIWHAGRRLESWRSQGQSNPQKKKSIRRLIQKFSALKSFLRRVELC